MDSIRLVIVEDNDDLRGFMSQYFSKTAGHRSGRGSIERPERAEAGAGNAV